MFNEITMNGLSQESLDELLRHFIVDGSAKSNNELVRCLQHGANPNLNMNEGNANLPPISALQRASQKITERDSPEKPLPQQDKRISKWQTLLDYGAIPNAPSGTDQPSPMAQIIKGWKAGILQQDIATELVQTLLTTGATIDEDAYKAALPSPQTVQRMNNLRNAAANRGIPASAMSSDGSRLRTLLTARKKTAQSILQHITDNAPVALSDISTTQLLCLANGDLLYKAFHFIRTPFSQEEISECLSSLPNWLATDLIATIPAFTATCRHPDARVHLPAQQQPLTPSTGAAIK